MITVQVYYVKDCYAIILQIEEHLLPDEPDLHEVASDILATSQKFMREQPVN